MSYVFRVESQTVDYLVLLCICILTRCLCHAGSVIVLSRLLRRRLSLQVISSVPLRIS
ncbi:hypothetical protein BDZ94DRAFT_1259160 [Collybia nuda]|uniref:Uncharacterized protein n=1 Tax=Collybia nuda TaxID=64659 RepID=A0A9P6CEY3_9AGAR|nr:hypothetical protein BDZ94DRAFT_1259160 [Collybia nuda]